MGARRCAGRRAEPAVPRLRQRRLPGARRGRGARRARRCWRCGSGSGSTRPDAFACFALLGALPWLGTKFVAAGVVIGAVAVRALWQGAAADAGGGRGGAARCSRWRSTWRSTRRSTAAPRPYAADAPGESATDASSPGGYLERAYRLVALFIDREYGLLRWAPVFVLAFVGLWWLWHSHRERLAQAVPGRARDRAVGRLCAAALGAQLLVAAFVAPTMFGFWFPPRHLLAGAAAGGPARGHGACATLPRLGSVLAVLTVAGSAWLYADVRWGDGSLVADRPDAPFGPLTDAAAAVRARRRLAVLAGGRGRRGRGCCSSCARRARRATRARRRAPRARGTRGSARTSVRSCGAGSGSAPRPASMPRAPEREREHLRVVVVVPRCARRRARGPRTRGSRSGRRS